VGHGKVDFNEFGNATFNEGSQEWSLIVRVKWFWKDQLNKDGK